MQAQAGLPAQMLPQRTASPSLPWRRSWHSDQDTAHRQSMRETIAYLFRSKAKSTGGPDWEKRAHDFALRLEDSLYNVAQSMEEYLDRSTLDKRLQMVAQQMQQGNTQSQQAAMRRNQMAGVQVQQQPMYSAGLAPMAAMSGGMIPTPGHPGASPAGMMPTPGSSNAMATPASMPTPGASTMIPVPGGSGMIPTPGMMPTPGLSATIGSSAMEGMRQHPGMVNRQCRNGASMPTSGTMIPTPGMAPAQSVLSAAAGGTVNGSAAGVQTQAYGAAAGSQAHLNGQMLPPGPVADGNGAAASKKVSPPGSHAIGAGRSLNGSVSGAVNGGPYANGGSSMHAGHGKAATPAQQARARQLQQQQQQRLMAQSGQSAGGLAAGQGAMMKPGEAAKLGASPFISRSGAGLSANALNACQQKPAGLKMIPVPGLPQQQREKAAEQQQDGQHGLGLPQQQQLRTPQQMAAQARQQQTARAQAHLQGLGSGNKGANGSALGGKVALSQQAQQLARAQQVQRAQAVKAGQLAAGPLHPQAAGRFQQPQPPNAQMQQRLQQQQQQQQQQSRVSGPVQGTSSPNAGQSPPSVGDSLHPGNGVGPGGRPGQQELTKLATNLALEPQRALQYEKQTRFIRFLRHGAKCPGGVNGECPHAVPGCKVFRELYQHTSRCVAQDCTYERCRQSKVLLEHHQNCRLVGCPVCIPVRHGNCKEPACPVCIPVRTAVANAKLLLAQSAQQAGAQPGSLAAAVLPDSAKAAKPVRPADALHLPPTKKVKVDGGAAAMDGFASRSGHAVAQVKAENGVKVERLEAEDLVKVEGVKDEGRVTGQVADEVKEVNGGPGFVKTDVDPIASASLVVETESGKIARPAVAEKGAIVVKPNFKGVGTSLAELFTPEMIFEHVKSLRESVSALKLKADKNQAGKDSSGDECKLCGVEKLFFDPPPIYCTSCGRRIQRNKVYYMAGSGEQRVYVCTKCHGESPNPITIEGYPPCFKNKLEKRTNDEDAEEGWVECGTCKSWVHQVCALFNIRRNEGNTDFTCPNCCASQMQSGIRQPLPPTAVLGAKDLPRTKLSDELENRLVERLTVERESRARAEGKMLNEVPRAEELVIRVVSSVDKRLETKARFLSIFPEAEYPPDFPYKSKVVLLFQKIEGVEVCLFGMYVQEFGSDCGQPNNRRVYLSYLDSVKYFRPEVRTESREALRTFVYHEILIGYLGYCKRRGFTSCYIWACPPLKGEDYILYCHPEIQKTPQPAKLREWYLAMLRKAQAEGIVVEVSNLYETFFVTCGESRAQVKAARLPYFDGDYWPGAIEEVLQQLQDEDKDDSKRKNGKKGKKVKSSSKRGAVKGDDDGLGSTDEVLMAKLGESILSMKEDFIMVHLQYCCTHCKNFILGDRRWVCPECANFNLCPSCYEMERMREPRERHPQLSKEAHDLVQEPLMPVPKEITDPDEPMESEFFDTRQAFLSLCQGNHYQYDTLRRAKHSSMMVLYHLHNPTAPAFVSSCNICHRDIDNGQGWRCEQQCDFDVCSSCNDNHPNIHPHPLIPHASQAETNAQNQAGRQKRVNRVRKMLDLLQHASMCKLGVNKRCTYPKCCSLHKLFKHGQQCTVRLNGGCELCKEMWRLLRFHAKSCKENHCNVPRCKDLKEHVRRATLQMESRRRAAVQEMMRQRAAEARRG